LPFLCWPELLARSSFNITQPHKFIEFDYDAMGNRVAKHTYASDFGLVKSTYYVLDAQGNTISTYAHTLDENIVSFNLQEHVLYGSSRLGMKNSNLSMLTPLSVDPSRDSVLVGTKSYELSNHLGNVLTVFRDVLNGDAVSGYSVPVASIADYSPFGVTLDGRTQSAGDYRYGFQGQEMDDEVKGEGNSVNYKYRMHDPRVGRFFAVDPLAGKYPHYTPYSFSGNKVIHAIELEGLEELVSTVDRTTGIPVLHVFTQSQLQNQIMFIVPGTAGTVNTITRPITPAERAQYAPSLSKNGPNSSRTRRADTKEASNFRDGNGQIVRQNLSLNNTGAINNPITSPANTTITNIDGDFGATAVGANQVFNFQIASGATAVTMTFNDGTTNPNTFVLTDLGTGEILTPIGGVSGTGAINIPIPIGSTNLQLTISGRGGALFDGFNANILSSGPEGAATNILNVNNTVNTPVRTGTSVVTQTTTPITVNLNVNSTQQTPVNR
jgi:RHS repeat-associated protein